MADGDAPQTDLTPTPFKIIDEATDPVPSDIGNATLLPTFVIDNDDIDLAPKTKARFYRFTVRSIDYGRCVFNRQTGTRYFVLYARRILCDCLPVPIPIDHEYTLQNPRWDEEEKALVLTRYDIEHATRCKVDLMFYCPQHLIQTVDQIYTATDAMRQST